MAENTKQAFVIDASFILSYLLPDEKSKHADIVFDAYAKNELSLISSSLLPFETVNSLRTAQMRKRISSKQALALITTFLALNVPLENVSFENVFHLAEKENLTAYDASYLLLARKNHLQLLTYDKQLQSLATRHLS